MTYLSLTFFYTNRPVGIGFFCHTEESQTFVGDSYSLPVEPLGAPIHKTT